MSSIALWAPDITPPDEWLVPALLYQERIATFAPGAFLRDADGQEARRLENLLGDLYEPVHFDSSLSRREDVGLGFREIARTRIPLWASYVEGKLDREPDRVLRMWVNRVNGWPSRFAFLGNAYNEAVREQQRAQRQLVTAEEDHRRVLAAVELRKADIQNQMAALKELLVAERSARQKALASLKIRRETYLRGRRHMDAGADAKIHAVNAEIRAWSELLRSGSPVQESYNRLIEEHSLLKAREKASDAKVTAARNIAREASNRAKRQRSYLDRPWSGGRDLFTWLDASRIDSRPSGLDTIALGKVYGPIFEFLANECGLWVAEDRSRPYAGTLVGPRAVVKDIMEILAECYSAARPGCVLMSGSKTLAPLYAPHDEEMVSVVLPYLLPSPRPRVADNSPDRDAYLTSVARFRQEHEQELQIMRHAIASGMPSDSARHSLDEAIEAVRQSISEPLADISRALELNRQLGLKPIGMKVLGHVRKGTIGLALSTAAAAIATPVIGDTIGVQGTAAAVIGGSIIGFTTLTTSSAADLYRRRRIAGRITGSPYRYLYEVGGVFGLGE